MTEPVILLAELNDLTGRLDGAGKEIYRLQTEVDDLQDQFDPVDEEYEDLFNDLLTSLIDQYEDEGKRLPGEDARNALVTRKIRKEHAELHGRRRRLQTELRSKQRELKRKERLQESIDRQISSKQSSLKSLRTEALAA